MDAFFSNEVVQWALALLVGVFILGLLGWLKFKRDEKLVAGFLRALGVDEEPTFRSTVEISSATRLHEKRVRKICSKSSRIKKVQEDSWKLHR